MRTWASKYFISMYGTGHPNEMKKPKFAGGGQKFK
jgi:hypothetical protein